MVRRCTYHGVLAPHYKHRKSITPRQRPVKKEKEKSKDSKEDQAKRMSWARLLKRVFKIDVEICGKCKGSMRIVASIEDPKIIKKILDHVGLPSEPPAAYPARGPPSEFDDNQFDDQMTLH